MSGIRLEPLGRIRARPRVPGDKSISHRALILNAIAGGSATVSGLAPGLDVRSTAAALRALGAGVETGPDGTTARVSGPAGWGASDTIDCGNSGTTARLLLGALAPRARDGVTLDGDASLRRRPMARVTDPLLGMGAGITARGEPGRLPLEVRGRPLAGRRHRLAVASAQVKSAILLAGLGAEGETVVEEPAVSRDHTERMLAAMGARIETTEGRVRLEPGPIAAIDVAVPGDLSSAAFFLGLAAAGGGEARIEGVGLNPGRTGFLALLGRFGAAVDVEPADGGPEPRGVVTVRADGLAGIEVAPAEVPGSIDELPLVAVVATQAEGETRVSGASELRVKESDRIAAIVAGLSAMGAEIEPLADGFAVHGPTRLTGAALDARGDHRIGMALAVAASLARGPSMLTGAEWVDVSYPGFFAALAGCGPARVWA
ncbi:MAG TPA: 3-phosphoshikimate 1-carboxyvinyltransferase [Gemmatimonadota bacterium]|nr:3-phosphoshikimate 1-carboxyvinyltransferase [Gemmatimonadota bacterium]